LTDWPGFWVFGLSATADAKHLAFMRESNHHSVFVADLADNGNRLLNRHPLIADEYLNLPSAWTADSREVIFESDRGGNLGIYKQALDGSAPEVVSASLALDVGIARLSSDGAWVFFSASPHDAPQGTPDKIYRVAVNGGAAQPLFEANVRNIYCTNHIPKFCAYESSSADGREVLLTTFDPIRGKGKEILRIPIERGRIYNRYLSPDGSVYANSPNAGQIDIIPLRGGETRTLDLKGHFVLSSLDWAPDSKSLYVGSRNANSTTLLHVDMNGRAQAVWQEPGVGLVWAIVSPDGRHIAMPGSTRSANVWVIDNF
jgi:eukaryotic-like serine/threonine-protein kinase